MEMLDYPLVDQNTWSEPVKLNQVDPPFVDMQNRLFERPDYLRDPLYVVTCVFNPERYRSRWALYKKFEKHIKDVGGTLYTIEAAFGDREYAIRAENRFQSSANTVPQKPLVENLDTFNGILRHKYIRVRTNHQIWIKENLMNVAVQQLPPNWKYVAFIDSDVHFARPDIIGETLHQLQKYKILQMYSEAQDLGPNYEPYLRHKGFAYCYQNGYEKLKFNQSYYGKPGVSKTPGFNLWQPGFAWAWRRDAFDAMGGLIDWGILGSGDNHMARALVGQVEESYHPDLHVDYRDMVHEWQERAEMNIRRNIGYVDGLLLHNFHGRKVNRRYYDRWRILCENKYSPLYDIKRDWQGIYQLVDRGTPRSIKLRDDIRNYFKIRYEDDLYLPQEDMKMG